MRKRYDIVGIGASLYDVFLVVPEYPREDTKMRAEELVFRCGGPVATGLVAAVRLGASASYVGTFSDDANSTAMLDDFALYGVDTGHATILPGYSAGVGIVINSQKNASRTVIWDNGSVPPPAPEQVPADLIRQAKILYLDGNHMEAGAHACRIAKENGVKVLLDAGNAYPGIEKIVRYTDILIASEHFVTGLTGKDSPEAGADILVKQYAPEALIVTQGAKGGFYWEEGGFTRYPSYPPPSPVVDTNAAGDVFHGAYAFCYTRGYGVRESVYFASAASAIKCARYGGRTAIPSYQEVVDFMEESDEGRE